MDLCHADVLVLQNFEAPVAGVTASHTFGDVLPFFSADPLKLCQLRWGPTAERHFHFSRPSRDETAL